MEYHRFRAMNSDILLAAEGEAERLAAGFMQVQALIEDKERCFTRFSEDSELAGLNLSAGRWFHASEQMLEVLKLARFYWQVTRGLFNPAILGALEQAGYDRSMDEIRAHGAAPAGATVPDNVPDFGMVQLNEDAGTIWMPVGMRLDLGGIAKGWIAEQAARELNSFAPACAVNAGGDMFLAGLPAGEKAWEVALEDPRDPERDLAILNVGPGAVATSSITKRRWQQGERLQHHLIDPRSGKPAETDWLSVTAIASSAAAAEVFAKALLIASSLEFETLAQNNPDIAFIAVDAGGGLWGSNNIWEYLDVANQPVSK
jgi:thiamine biosynthesis lipoprotein